MYPRFPRYREMTSQHSAECFYCQLRTGIKIAIGDDGDDDDDEEEEEEEEGRRRRRGGGGGGGGAGGKFIQG